MTTINGAASALKKKRKKCKCKHNKKNLFLTIHIKIKLVIEKINELEMSPILKDFEENELEINLSFRRNKI